MREWVRGLPVFQGDLPGFDTDAAPAEPAELFLRWLREALDAGVAEPHAMTLATVDADGRPSARVLLLKGLDGGTWQFASGRTSRKGRELASAPWAALTFYWREQGRQVRVRGRVVEAGPEASARDFQSRSPASRAEGLTGRQSDVLDDASQLDEALRRANERLEAEPELVAPGWTLYNVEADEVEFFQAHPTRRHVRLRYARNADAWDRDLLWP